MWDNTDNYILYAFRLVESDANFCNEKFQLCGKPEPDRHPKNQDLLEI